MTTDEFFEKLRACRNRYRWIIRHDSAIRTLGVCRCPIVTVAEDTTGKHYGSNWRLAAGALDFPIDEAREVAKAADFLSGPVILRTRLLNLLEPVEDIKSKIAWILI
jgi:hypothetical protein